MSNKEYYTNISIEFTIYFVICNFILGAWEYLFLMAPLMLIVCVIWNLIISFQTPNNPTTLMLAALFRGQKYPHFTRMDSFIPYAILFLFGSVFLNDHLMNFVLELQNAAQQ